MYLFLSIILFAGSAFYLGMCIIEYYLEDKPWNWNLALSAVFTVVSAIVAGTIYFIQQKTEGKED